MDRTCKAMLLLQFFTVSRSIFCFREIDKKRPAGWAGPLVGRLVVGIANLLTF
jgi:hypothetical protein